MFLKSARQLVRHAAERFDSDAPLTIVERGHDELQRNVIASRLVKPGGLDHP